MALICGTTPEASDFQRLLGRMAEAGVHIAAVEVSSHALALGRVAGTHFEVADISKTVKAAEAAGAVIAYPPTRQGDTGTWAIYIIDGIQYGLWQR